ETVAQAEQGFAGVFGELEQSGNPAAVLAVPLRFDFDEPFERVRFGLFGGLGGRRRVEGFVSGRTGRGLLGSIWCGHAPAPRAPGRVRPVHWLSINGAALSRSPLGLG